jgi:hypothetical protein
VPPRLLACQVGQRAFSATLLTSSTSPAQWQNIRPHSHVVRLRPGDYNPPLSTTKLAWQWLLRLRVCAFVIDISLILPTRKRVPQLMRALTSMVATARRPEALEIVLYVDEDDADSRDVEFPGLRLVKLIERRGTMGAITRACYEACRGRYIMLANDDIVFRTPDWDAEVLATFERFSDTIALVWGNDLCSGAPAHPFLSRTTCDLLGGVCPAGYYREFIDAHLHDVFRRLARRGHARAVYLPEVIIEHLHFIAGKAAADEGYVHRRREHDELLYVERREQRAHQATVLANFIEQRLAPAAACGDTSENRWA